MPGGVLGSGVGVDSDLFRPAFIDIVRVMTTRLGPRIVTALISLFLFPTTLPAWVNGQLLIWMEDARAQALRPTTHKFETTLGIKVLIESPANLTTNFPIVAQAAKGPDIVIWAHDKVGEWADGGLIAPLTISPAFMKNFLPSSWEAVTHRDSLWGYPIALETVTLLYNKKLVNGAPPVQLSDLYSLNRQISQQGSRTILWECNSAYYSWGILASDGGYIFGRSGTDFNVRDIGVSNSGAVEGLQQIVDLVRAGLLAKDAKSSDSENLMARGKLAMTISGPWSWPNLVKNQIDFGISSVPGINGKPGRPLVGVSAAYINRSSPNLDIATEFLQHYLLTPDALQAMDRANPIGVPALLSYYEQASAKNPLVRDLREAVEKGSIMPNIPQMGRFFS
ncbi:MAG: maltose/maltodextrin ABC transporter substrate-binding protein MalE, partial [Verrucomicrobia bacterium]|nr:maltose/maltodextrin ABC transporter substrate-binding protein MalE [Verrucomicrobiota bacterium]